MRIVAVVLNWRQADETVACVTSLRAAAPAVEALVVDNASGDGSAERIRAALPDVTLVENARNDGYAGGNNAGLRRALAAGADAVLVLNNDVVVRPGCVDALAAALDRHPAWGIASPLSLRRDAPGVVDFFTARADLAHGALLPDGRDERRSFSEDAESDYATGSALLVRRAVLEAIGGFDERFFLVWEDVDFSLRARRAGFRVGATPAAEVLHGRSVSFGGEASPLYSYFFVRNSFLAVREHVPAWRRARALRLLRRRYPGWAERSEPAVAAAIRLGLAHGAAGRFGPPPAELLPAASSAS